MTPHDLSRPAAGTAARPRIALVEDDADLRETLLEFFGALGWPAWGVGSAEAFYKRLLVDPADILILDLGLPGEDGLAVAAHVRGLPGPAVIVLSARDRVQDRLDALAAGADRYLVKPVELAELAANVEALWRRPAAPAGPAAAIGPAAGRAATACGHWRLTAASARLETPDGLHLRLTHGEVRLLRALAADPGRVVAREHLIEAVFGRNPTTGSARLDVLIARLRRKARNQCACPLPLETAHGLGYVLSAPLLVVGD